MTRRHALALALVAALAGCAADGVYAPVTEVRARAWAEGGPASLTLVTAVSNRDGSGGHAALIVSGSQRVVFDPAGTWWHPLAPERGDVKHGMTPALLDIYVDYHARPAYHVVMQRIEVPAATAERALAIVQTHGLASKATCGRAVSGILRELGFAQVRRSWFPTRIMHDFAGVPGVVETRVFDDTEDGWAPGRPAPAFDADGNLVSPAT